MEFLNLLLSPLEWGANLFIWIVAALAGLAAALSLLDKRKTDKK